MELIADIHTHIIPAADDGSQNIDTSLQLLEDAYRQGVTTVFATSHSIAYIDPWDARETMDQYHLLKKAMEESGIPIQLYLGCEIFCNTDWIDRICEGLEAKQYPSMNHTRYVLIEFSSINTNLEEVMYCSNLLMAHGWVPIYAHIERYLHSFASIDFIRQQKAKGCLFQINYESICDQTETDVAEFTQIILRNELADFMGSDTHNLHHRPPRVLEGLEYLKYNCTPEYYDQLLFGNVFQYLIKES